MTDNGGQEPHFDITKITAFEVIAHSAIKASEEQKITILSKETLTKLLTKRYTSPSSSVTFLSHAHLPIPQFPLAPKGTRGNQYIRQRTRSEVELLRRFAQPVGQVQEGAAQLFGFRSGEAVRSAVAVMPIELVIEPRRTAIEIGFGYFAPANKIFHVVKTATHVRDAV